jgi:DNA-binding MarR family transcriptional regulator
MPDKSKVQTEIDFLASLEDGQIVSQTSLAGRISVSVGLVNALLKRAVQKGYVKMRKAPYRRYAYYVTPKGFTEKSRLVAKYLETSLDFFRQARQEYMTVFARAQGAGVRKVVLVGRGELAEIALIAAREVSFEVVGVFDRETNAEHLHGLPVLRDWSDCEEVDAVVITDSRHPQQVFDQMLGIWTDARILTPPFLRIAREVPQAVADLETETEGGE